MDVGCPLKLYNDLHTMLPYSHRKKKSGWSLTNVKKKQSVPWSTHDKKVCQLELAPSITSLLVNF